MCELLLKHGADVNIICQNYDETVEDVFSALITACIFGHVKVLELLLSYNAEVNKTDERGFTPLLYLLSPYGDWSGWMGRSGGDGTADPICTTTADGVGASAVGVGTGDGVAVISGVESVRHGYALEGDGDEDVEEEGESEEWGEIEEEEREDGSKLGCIQCAELLLSHGTDLSIKNNEGKTVYDYIKEDSIIMRLIKEHSAVKPVLK